MPLQTSGPISLANIQAEFGGSNPISISEYLRGGLVPDTPANASIKTTTSNMSFADYYGGSSAPALSVSLTNITESILATDFTSPYSASSTLNVYFLNDGRIYVSGTQSPASTPSFTNFYRTNEWLTVTTQPTTTTDDYEIRATLQSGSNPTGTMNTWLNLGTYRGWSITASRSGTQGQTIVSTSFLIEIRLASSGVVQDSCVITLTAEASIEF